MASIIIIAVVLVLDVLAFVLAIGAERRRSYVRDHQHSALLIPSLSSQPISLFFFGFHSFRDSMDRARTHERAGLRERGLERAGLLRVQLRRVDGVRRQRAAPAAGRAGRGHGRHPLLLLRTRALAGTPPGMVRHLLHRLLVTSLLIS